MRKPVSKTSSTDSRSGAKTARSCAWLIQARRGIERLLDGDTGASESTEAVVLAIQSGLCALLAAVSQAGPGPVIVVLDDVQWMAEASSRIGAPVLHALAGQHGLVALLLRRKTGALPGRWRSRLQLERIDIEPLDLADTRSLVIGLLGAGVARKLAAGIAEHAAGNPFMAEQVASLMIDRGTVVPASGGWAARPDADPGDIPATVQDVVAARITCLPSGSQTVLAACAIIGDTVERHVLGRTIDLARKRLGDTFGGPATIAPHVARLQARGLVQVQTDATNRRRDLLTFRHRIIRDTAVRILDPETYRAFHIAAAETLAKRYEDALRPWFGAIAGHYDAGGDTGAALSWRMRAGRHAMAVGALVEARRDLERAVTLATDSGSTRTLSAALCALAEVQLARGDCEEAGETCDRGLQAAPDANTAARLLYVQARALTELQQAERAADVANLAQGRAPASDAELRGRLCLLRARLSRYAMDIEATDRHLAEAETLVANVADDSLRADVWVERAYLAAQRADTAVVQRLYGGSLAHRTPRTSRREALA